MTEKRRIGPAAFLCLVILMSLFTAGCGGTETETFSGADKNQPVFFNMYGEKLTDKSEGVAHVNAYYEDLSEAWSFDSDHYPLATVSDPFEIGESDNGYYLEAGGILYCLNKEDGSVKWKKSEACGAVTGSKFDDEGNLYVCSYFGPVLSVISPDGEVLEQYSDFTFTNSEEDPADFFWPTDLRLEDGRVKIHFESNDRAVSLDPSSGEAELLPQGTEVGLTAAIPQLKKLMGGWGTLDCRTSEDSTDVAIAEFTDENGRLKVDFATITGGGSYVVFDEDDISFDGDVMTCVNGLVVLEGARYRDGRLVASPSAEKEGGYTFVLSSESEEALNSRRSNSYIYSKVGNTHSELQKWIDENHESI